MGKVVIQEPHEYSFKANYQIRISDINYGNHLSNDKILTMAQEVRMMWLSSLGFSELDFFGVSLIQGDSAAIYKSEGFYANEIEIQIGVMDLSNSSFDIVYKMYNKTTKKDLALVKTRMVCFDYKIRKVKVIPDVFRNLSGL